MPFRIVTDIECAIASADDTDELSVVRVGTEVIKSLMLNEDARRSEVEPRAEQLLENTGGVQWRRRPRSKIYEATGKTWT